MIERGSGTPSKASIQLEDANTGTTLIPYSARALADVVSAVIGDLFATTPYTPSKTNPNGGVEAVLDSSRYFVLTVLDPVRRSSTVALSHSCHSTQH